MSVFTFSTAHLVRPMVGLNSCGDAVVEAALGDWRLFAVIDALGHGPDAERSAVAASRAAAAAAGRPLETVFEAVHRALPGLRNVVMAALLVEGASLSYAGVGNIELFSPGGVSQPVSMAGTLGGGRYRFRSFGLPLEVGQRWVLASDGVRAREADALLSKLRAAQPPVVAQQLLEQLGRPHDDASVLVIDVGAGS